MALPLCVMVAISDVNENIAVGIGLTCFLEGAKILLLLLISALHDSGWDSAKKWKNTVRKVALVVFLA